jgi:hypothetical protein
MSLNPLLATTARDIIRAALQEIGEVDAEVVLDSVQFSDGLRDLNYMVKSYQSQGLHLWTKTEAVLFMNVGQAQYKIGGVESGRAYKPEDIFYRTLAVDALTGATSIDVGGTSNAGYYPDQDLGIPLADGSRQWVKIVTVPGIGQINIDQPLSADALAGAVIPFVVETKTTIDRPLRVLQLRRKTIGMGDEIEAEQWSRQEYFAQPDKESQGEVNNWYYSPQLESGDLYVWQVPSGVNQIANFTYERPINITEENADQPDFPSEWFDVLRFNLASRISIQYKVPQDRRVEIKMVAEDLLQSALGYDIEPDSINVQPYFGN